MAVLVKLVPEAGHGQGVLHAEGVGWTVESNYVNVLGAVPGSSAEVIICSYNLDYVISVALAQVPQQQVGADAHSVPKVVLSGSEEGR